MALKTKLFTSRELGDSFKSDIYNIQALSNDNFKQLVNWFKDQSSLPKLGESTTRYFVEKFDKKPEDVNASIDAIFRLLRFFALEKDVVVNDFIHDLKTVIDEDVIQNENLLKERIQRLQQLSDQYSLFIYKRIAQKTGIPTLQSSSSSITIKPIIDNREDREEDIENYDPNILGFVHNLIIRLETNEGNGFDFQMTEDGFEDFLDTLISLKIELNKSKQQI